MLDALERADAGILCVQPQEGELGARMAIVAIVERRRIRYAHMVGVTPEIMMQGMRADYRLVDRLSTQLCERMRTARVAARRDAVGHGADARRSIPRSHWVKTSGLINPRYWSNLPAGEVFTTPASVDGVVRLQRHGRRLLQRRSTATSSATPLTLEIAAAGWCRARCEREGAGARVLGLLPHRREQRPRRRAGLRHQPRARPT